MGEKSCVSVHASHDLAGETPTDLNGMIDALMEYYMQIDCICFSFNDEHIDNIIPMARKL